MLYSLMYFNLIAIPVYFLYRLYKNKYLVLLNPCFYMLFLSYIYLTIPCLYIDDFLKTISFVDFFASMKQESINLIKILSNWFNLVLLFFYIISKDKKIVATNFVPKRKTYQIALGLILIISLILSFIFVLHKNELLQITDRVEALKYYGENIADKYKLFMLVNILLGSLAVILWRTKNFKWYLVLLLPIGIELLSKGRTMSLFCIVFAYINHVFITKKSNATIISILILGLVSTAFFRGGSQSNSFDWQFFTSNLLADPTFSWLSAVVIYERFLEAGNLFEYLFESFSNLLPGVVSKILFGIDTESINNISYTTDLLYDREIGFSLATNLVSEALYYGGVTFAIVSPIIIGGIFYSMNKFKIYETFPGFLYFCFLMASLQKITRNTFYDNVLVLVYLMFSYLIWITVLEWGRVVFVKYKDDGNSFIPKQ